MTVRGLWVAVVCGLLAACSTAAAEGRPCPTGDTSAADYVSFVRFEGREYLEVSSAPDEEQLDPGNLREQVGQTRCQLQDNNDDPAYRPQDGDAAFLPPGTPLFAVAGFDTAFRLAARTRGEVLLYELDSDPDAREGRDLLDLDGRVPSITVNSDEGDAEDAIARITDPAEVDRLVQLVLDAPVEHDPVRTEVEAGPSYHLEFEVDGTPAVTRVLSTRGNLLHRGIRVPDAFSAAIVEAVPHDGQGLTAAGFDHDGRRHELSCGVIDPDLVEPARFATAAGHSLHRIRGVDPAVLLAVPNDVCDLAPDQAWQSAAATGEYRNGRPSAAYNAAWCTASLYGPDPAEGFSC